MSPAPVVLIGGGLLFAFVSALIFLTARRPADDADDHLGRGLVGTIGFGLVFFASLTVAAYGAFMLLTQ